MFPNWDQDRTWPSNDALADEYWAWTRLPKRDRDRDDTDMSAWECVTDLTIEPSPRNARRGIGQ